MWQMTSSSIRAGAPYLHDLGECEVKHGVRIGLANLYDSEVGNAQLPKKLQVVKSHRAHVRWAAVSIGLLVVAALAALVLSFLRKGPARSLATAVEKSIAVLPFENLSEEKQNEYFADGVQDEILTDLSQIADLKVISRTSVMQYKSGVAAQSARDRTATRRGACRRRQCAARGQQSARQRAVDRCPHRCASLGANLRSRSGRCLRHPKRNRQGDCRSVAGEALA